MSPWLAIIGIGEDGRDGLTPAAAARLAQAECVVGGARHLKLAAPLPMRALPWPSPIDAALPEIDALRGRAVAVLASGDPFFFGVGSLLARRFSPDEIIAFPAPSAFTLAAARLGWGLQDVACVSLHGRPLEAIIPHLQPRAKILALSWDGRTPKLLGDLLAKRGFGGSRVTALEAMGGPHERRIAFAAREAPSPPFADLNTLALDVEAEDGAFVIPRAPGLPDALFENDGQITKRAVRAITLSALAPRRGELLWDIGAGSGSVGIEWMLADAANRAIALERDAERATRIRRNALNLGVPALVVDHADAAEAMTRLPPPDAIFIGGGGPTLFAPAFAALKPGGRLVVNAVTLQTQAALIQARARWAGELTQIAIAEAEPVGRFDGWRAAMPVVQWRTTKR